MSEHPDIVHRPYAAGIAPDAEEVYNGDTPEEAIAAALEAHLDALACDVEEAGMPRTVAVVLYTGAVWCTGMSDPCACGGGHEYDMGDEPRWLLYDWAAKETRTEWTGYGPCLHPRGYRVGGIGTTGPPPAVRMACPDCSTVQDPPCPTYDHRPEGEEKSHAND